MLNKLTRSFHQIYFNSLRKPTTCGERNHVSAINLNGQWVIKGNFEIYNYELHLLKEAMKEAIEFIQQQEDNAIDR